MKETTFDIWALVSELVTRVPGLLIEREAFLREAFAKKLDAEHLRQLIEEGDYSSIPPELLDSVANAYINKMRLATSGASFVAGLPSNLIALPAAITADVTQSFAFDIRIAQKLAYIYGEKNDFTRMQDEDRMTNLLLYIGAMFGINGAVKALAMMGENAGKILAGKFGKVAVTQVLGGIPWKVAKTVAKLLGIKLTKEVAKKGITKAVPVLGGVVSGALTYATFGPMTRRLQDSLRDARGASEAEIIEIYEEMSAEDDVDIALAAGADLLENAVADASEMQDGVENQAVPVAGQEDKPAKQEVVHP